MVNHSERELEGYQKNLLKNIEESGLTAFAAISIIPPVPVLAKYKGTPFIGVFTSAQPIERLTVRESTNRDYNNPHFLYKKWPTFSVTSAENMSVQVGALEKLHHMFGQKKYSPPNLRIREIVSEALNPVKMDFGFQLTGDTSKIKIGKYTLLARRKDTVTSIQNEERFETLIGALSLLGIGITGVINTAGINEIFRETLYIPKTKDIS